MALIATGSAGAWQPWFFLVVFTIGLAGWWLPNTVLDRDALASRSVLGLTRRVPLEQITAVGYGPLGIWIDGVEPAMILHAVQGIRPLGGVASNQQGGPSGQQAVTVIRDRAAVCRRPGGREFCLWTSAFQVRRGRVDQPPATAGTTETCAPSGVGVARPSVNRTSSLPT